MSSQSLAPGPYFISAVRMAVCYQANGWTSLGSLVSGPGHAISESVRLIMVIGSICRECSEAHLLLPLLSLMG